MKKRLICLATVLFFHYAGSSQLFHRHDSANVVKRTEDFIQAFNNLKWETFISFFADDATMFYPQADNARRLVGKKEIEDALLPDFTDTIVKAPNVSPEDIRVQLNRRTAIVTFHLEDKHRLGRYTIIWIRRQRAWKILHLHASDLTLL
jgi:ketosteroid isomerase-like protein